MKKDELMRKFKAETGIRPVIETTLDLEESEYIDDYYLVSKCDADAIKDVNQINIILHNTKYIEWLEEHFKD